MKHCQNINVVGDVHAAGEHLNREDLSDEILNKQRGTVCAEHRTMESIIWKLHFDWILSQHRRPPNRGNTTFRFDWEPRRLRIKYASRGHV